MHDDISQPMRAGATSAPSPSERTPLHSPRLPLHHTLSQREFLAHFGPALTERVANACPPMYRGPSDTPWAALSLLKRKPLGAQGLIAQAGAAAVRGLRPSGRPGDPGYRPARTRRRGLGLVAEMATGKSLLSLAILGLADEDVTRQRARDDQRPQKARYFPAVVLCPPIVAAKWAREAMQTLPTARPVVIRQIHTKAEVAAFRQFDPTFTGKHLSTIGCAERVIRRIQAELALWRQQRDKAIRAGHTPPRKPCHVAILSTSTAKLGPAWTPIYLLRALRDVDERGRPCLLRDAASGEPVVVPSCPRCFAPLKDESRVDRLEREREKEKRRRGVHGNAVTNAPSSAGDDGDDGDDEEMLDVYLRENDLLGFAGCPRTKRVCTSCGEPLWQVVPDSARWEAASPPLGGTRRTVPRLPIPGRTHRPPCLTSTLERRYPLADYLRKRHRGLFRSLICDEAHQFKGAGTAQGFAAASLVDACDPGGTTLFLTGTLFSGYASDLFPMLWRLLPELRQTFGYGELKRWVDLYGVRQKVVKVREPRPGHREDGAVSKRREDRPLIKELPGISPLVLRHLLDSCLFLELADVAPGLPPYAEEVEVVPLGEPLGPVYERFERESTAALKEMLAHEDHSGLAAWFQGLMIQPNLPWRGYIAISSRGDMLGQAEPLPEETIYPKEQALLDLVRRERMEGRRVLVYAEHTGEYDLLPRLKGLLEVDDTAWRRQWTEQSTRTEDSGGTSGGDDGLRPPQPPMERIRVALLRSATVATGEREAWLRRTVDQGCDVLICHSGLVEVGLDLLDFPTIACYETIFSTCRARQATRRSYRPGQTLPVRVVQLVYDRSMEARGLQLIASKIKSSLMVEGKLPSEGLAAFRQSTEDQGNLLLELARSVLSDADGDVRDVAGSLEATFRELAATESEQDGYIGDVELPTVLDDADDVQDSLSMRVGAERVSGDSPVEIGATSSGGFIAVTQREAQGCEATGALQQCTEQVGKDTCSLTPAASASASASLDDGVPSPADPWAHWRERQRQMLRVRRRTRVIPTSATEVTGHSGAAIGHGGSLWDTPCTTAKTGAPSHDRPAVPPGCDAQPVQATMWDSE